MRTTHYENCENATSETCKCAWCCGTRHGWQGGIKLATSDDPTPLRELRDQYEKDWQREEEKQNGRANKSPTYPHKSAAIGLCLANLLSLLRTGWSGMAKVSLDVAGNPASTVRDGQSSSQSGRSETRTISSMSRPFSAGSYRAKESVDSERHAQVSASFSQSSVDQDPGVQTREALSVESESPIVDQAQRVGAIMSFALKEVEKDYRKAHKEEIPIALRRAMADHFWCEELAQLAHALDQGVKIFDSLPDHISGLVMRCRQEEKRLPLEELIVKSATKALWKRIRALTLFGLLSKGRIAVLTLRILAVLVCKQPGRHRAVVEYCIDPLGKELLEETKKRLLAVLHEWLPQIKKELGENGGDEAMLAEALAGG